MKKLFIIILALPFVLNTNAMSPNDTLQRSDPALNIENIKMKESSYYIKNGKLYLFKNGKLNAVSATVTFKNGTTLSTTGEIRYKNGTGEQLQPDERIDTNGEILSY